MLTHQPPELLRDGRMSPAVDVYRYGICHGVQAAAGFVRTRHVQEDELVKVAWGVPTLEVAVCAVIRKSLHRTVSQLMMLTRLLCASEHGTHMYGTHICFSCMQFWHHDVRGVHTASCVCKDAIRPDLPPGAP
jgi:hypothetical protein